ncbi:MAG: hypothetical protein OES38_05850 [Gammaproteobacteria bacterium]|nr:hypothetical protein [Gammaproteobacteria bacterium]
MMSYSTAWWVIVAMAGLGLAGLYMLIRPVSSRYLKALLCGLVLALFLVPAPVPGHPSNYAPAFIVTLFEGFLKSDGEPGVALRLLVAGFAVVIAVVTGSALGLRRWKRAPETPD